MKSRKIHYIHSLSYSARDKLAGSFVLVALLMMLGLFAGQLISSKIFDPVVHYQAIMKNAQGITTKTIINIAGIDVGRVSDIYFGEKKEVNVHFFIYKKFQQLIRGDSTGEVSRLSILGDNVIIINAGSPNLPMLPEDAIISIQEPAVTDYLTIAEIAPAIKKSARLVSDLSLLLDAIDPQVIKESNRNLQLVLADLSVLSGQLAQGKGVLGQALMNQEQAKSIADAVALLQTTLSGISQRVEEAHPLIVNAGQLTEETKKLLAETVQLSLAARQLMIDANATIDLLNQQLIRLPELLDGVQTILDSGGQTLSGVRPVHVLIDNQIWPVSANGDASDRKLLIEHTGFDE